MHGGCCSCMAVERPWSALDGSFISFPAQTGVEMLLSPCMFEHGSISGTVGRYRPREAFCDRRTLTINLMSRCGQGRELAKNI